MLDIPSFADSLVSVLPGTVEVDAEPFVGLFLYCPNEPDLVWAVNYIVAHHHDAVELRDPIQFDDDPESPEYYATFAWA